MDIIKRIEDLTGIVKIVTDLAKSGGDSVAVIRDMRAKCEALQKELDMVKSDALALHKENCTLTARVAQLQRFRREKKRYETKTLTTGALVYVEKEHKGTVVKNPAYLCAHCFDRGEKSHLQPEKLDFHQDTYSCHACGAKVLVPNDAKMLAITASTEGEFDEF